MKVKSIRVAYGVTRNLGNYESLRLQYEVEAEVSEDEDPKNTLDGLRISLRTIVDAAVKEEIDWDGSRL